MPKGQEEIIKDVELFFGCLQCHFCILRREVIEWINRNMVDISNVWVSLHNMIVDLTKRDGLLEDGTERFISGEINESPETDETENEAASEAIRATYDQTKVLMLFLETNQLVTSRESCSELFEALSSKCNVSLHLRSVDPVTVRNYVRCTLNDVPRVTRVRELRIIRE